MDLNSLTSLDRGLLLSISRRLATSCAELEAAYDEQRAQVELRKEEKEELMGRIAKLTGQIKDRKNRTLLGQFLQDFQMPELKSLIHGSLDTTPSTTVPTTPPSNDCFSAPNTPTTGNMMCTDGVEQSCSGRKDTKNYPYPISSSQSQELFKWKNPEWNSINHAYSHAYAYPYTENNQFQHSVYSNPYINSDSSEYHVTPEINRNFEQPLDINLHYNYAHVGNFINPSKVQGFTSSLPLFGTDANSIIHYVNKNGLNTYTEKTDNVGNRKQEYESSQNSGPDSIKALQNEHSAPVLDTNRNAYVNAEEFHDTAPLINRIRSTPATLSALINQQQGQRTLGSAAKTTLSAESPTLIYKYPNSYPEFVSCGHCQEYFEESYNNISSPILQSHSQSGLSVKSSHVNEKIDKHHYGVNRSPMVGSLALSELVTNTKNDLTLSSVSIRESKNQNPENGPSELENSGTNNSKTGSGRVSSDHCKLKNTDSKKQKEVQQSNENLKLKVGSKPSSLKTSISWGAEDQLSKIEKRLNISGKDIYLTQILKTKSTSSDDILDDSVIANRKHKEKKIKQQLAPVGCIYIYKPIKQKNVDITTRMMKANDLQDRLLNRASSRLNDQDSHTDHYDACDSAKNNFLTEEHSGAHASMRLPREKVRSPETTDAKLIEVNGDKYSNLGRNGNNINNSAQDASPRSNNHCGAASAIKGYNTCMKQNSHTTRKTRNETKQHKEGVGEQDVVLHTHDGTCKIDSYNAYVRKYRQLPGISNMSSSLTTHRSTNYNTKSQTSLDPDSVILPKRKYSMDEGKRRGAYLYASKSSSSVKRRLMHSDIHSVPDTPQPLKNLSLNSPGTIYGQLGSSIGSSSRGSNLHGKIPPLNESMSRRKKKIFAKTNGSINYKKRLPINASLGDLRDRNLTGATSQRNRTFEGNVDDEWSRSDLLTAKRAWYSGRQQTSHDCLTTDDDTEHGGTKLKKRYQHSSDTNCFKQKEMLKVKYYNSHRENKIDVNSNGKEKGERETKNSSSLHKVTYIRSQEVNLTQNSLYSNVDKSNGLRYMKKRDAAQDCPILKSNRTDISNNDGLLISSSRRFTYKHDNSKGDKCGRRFSYSSNTEQPMKSSESLGHDTHDNAGKVISPKDELSISYENNPEIDYNSSIQKNKKETFNEINSRVSNVNKSPNTLQNNNKSIIKTSKTHCLSVRVDDEIYSEIKYSWSDSVETVAREFLESHCIRLNFLGGLVKILEKNLKYEVKNCVVDLADIDFM